MKLRSNNNNLEIETVPESDLINMTLMNQVYILYEWTVKSLVFIENTIAFSLNILVNSSITS